MGHHEDRADIIAITHDYCWALDRNEWHELDDVFLLDATAVLGSHTCADRDEIKQVCSAALGPLDDSQHIVATHQVEIDGDTATSRCYLHAQHIRRDAEGGPHYIVAGRYEDDFVRTADGWRIKHRDLIVMWTEGNLKTVRRD
jgi:hypothetical protein